MDQVKRNTRGLAASSVFELLLRYTKGLNKEKRQKERVGGEGARKMKSKREIQLKLLTISIINRFGLATVRDKEMSDKDCK